MSHDSDLFVLLSIIRNQELSGSCWVLCKSVFYAFSKFNETVEGIGLVLLPWIVPGWLWWRSTCWFATISTECVAVPSSHVAILAHTKVDTGWLSKSKAACGVLVVPTKIGKIHETASEYIARGIVLGRRLERAEGATRHVLLLRSCSKSRLETRLRIRLLVGERRYLRLLEAA